MVQSPIVQVQGLTAKLGGEIILEEISLAVYPGEIFMIVGTSGSGKSTLLNHMSGLLKPVAGTVTIAAQDIHNSSEVTYQQILKKIGVLYQSSALFSSMSVLENICFPLEELTQLPAAAIAAIAHNKLKMVGLTGFANYLPAQLSGGMQKRAALARAMVLDPQILFLDEPSAGLDPLTALELDELIVNLAKVLGITFVIVSHDLASIYQIAERVVLLKEHHIVAQGRPQELRESNSTFVKSFFLRQLVENG